MDTFSQVSEFQNVAGSSSRLKNTFRQDIISNRFVQLAITVDTHTYIIQDGSFIVEHFNTFLNDECSTIK